MGAETHFAASPASAPALASSTFLGHPECDSPVRWHSHSPIGRHVSNDRVGILDAAAPPPPGSSPPSQDPSSPHNTPPVLSWSMPPPNSSLNHSFKQLGPLTPQRLGHLPTPPQHLGYQPTPPQHFGDPPTPPHQLSHPTNLSQPSHSCGHIGYNPPPSPPQAYFIGSNIAPIHPGESEWKSVPAAPGTLGGVGSPSHAYDHSASLPAMHPNSPGSWVGGAWGVRAEDQPQQNLEREAKEEEEDEEEEELPRPRSSLRSSMAKDLPVSATLTSIGNKMAPHLVVNEGLRRSMDLARLERSQLDHQTLQLDRHLAHLERIVGCIVSRPEKAEEGEQVWQWGVKHYEERFVTEPLNGYHIDKSHVVHREAQLRQHRLERGEHSFLDWLAGKSERRIAAERQVLDEQAWRNLVQFGEVEQDAFAD